MRIVFFDFNTHFGGAQQCTVNLARRLAGTEEVHAIDAYGCCERYLDAIRAPTIKQHTLYSDARRTTIGDAKCRRLIRTVLAFPNLMRVRSRMADLIDDVNPDIISTTGIKALALMTSSRPVRRIPCVYFLHRQFERRHVSLLQKWLFRYAVDGFLAVSQAVRRNICELGVPEDRVVAIGNAIDVDEVRQDAEQPLAEPLPRTDAVIRMVLVASLIAAKGHLCAIRALARLVREGRDAALWFVGDPVTGGDSSFLCTVKATAEHLGVLDRLFLLGRRDDAVGVMRAATVVVLPSHTEGLPMCIMEAMALGRVVAATRVGGIPELIVPGRTGLLFDVEDDKGLASCIRRLTDNPVLVCRMTDAAQAHIRGNFSIQTHTRRVLEVFHRVVEQQRKH